jgi:hypothetical protein
MAPTLQLEAGVNTTTLEPIQIETLTKVTGGMGGWLGILSGKTDDPNGLGTMLGGGGGGLNGKGGGLAESLSGWVRNKVGGGNSTFRTIEGKGR